MRFWNRNKPDHDCKEHCGHAQILESVVNEQIRPKAQTLSAEYVKEDRPSFAMKNKMCDHLPFLKEVLKVKKYQLLAKKYNLEFELSEDI